LLGGEAEIRQGQGNVVGVAQLAEDGQRLFVLGPRATGVATLARQLGELDERVRRVCDVVRL
jgi:hypothetical protein